MLFQLLFIVGVLFNKNIWEFKLFIAYWNKQKFSLGNFYNLKFNKLIRVGPISYRGHTVFFYYLYLLLTVYYRWNSVS